jgi:NAD(P)-dependent dehydrogenase (short-subunit alcohol dehydrogenase family)
MDINKNLFSLTNKVVIVTGSAHGLGKVIAKGLVSFGAKVVVCDIDLEEALKTAKEINSSGGKVIARYIDITIRDRCDELLKFTLEEFGQIDILINNAAIDIIKPLEELSDTDWDKILAVNLKGHFICSQIVSKKMIQQGTGGSIINISSIASTVGIERLIPYSVAKGGLNQLTRSMAVELAPHKIRVNAIAPGYLNNIMQGAESEHNKPSKEKQVTTFTPMKRRGNPDELIGPVVFLASEASSYITGVVLFVDGGYTAC